MIDRRLIEILHCPPRACDDLTLSEIACTLEEDKGTRAFGGRGEELSAEEIDAQLAAWHTLTPKQKLELACKDL